MLSTSRPGTSRSSITGPDGRGGVQRLPGSGVRLGVKNGTTTAVSVAGPVVPRAATDQTPSFSWSIGSM
jgi:hypothetical protein